MSNETKICPYCGTVLQIHLRQCGFCGQMQPMEDVVQMQYGDDETQMQGDSDATQMQYGDEGTQMSNGGDATRIQSDSDATQMGYGYPHANPAGYQQPPVQPQKSNTLKYLLILAAVLLLAGGGVGAYFLLKDKGNSGNYIATGNDDDTEDFRTRKERPKNKVKPVKDVDDEDDVGERRVEPAPVPTPISPVREDPPAVDENNYHYLQGDIVYASKGNVYNFQMNLVVNGNQVSGDYIVTNGENVWVTLKGTTNSSGKTILYEYKGGTPTSYYFEGKLSGGYFSGKYKTSARSLVMEFTASPR